MDGDFIMVIYAWSPNWKMNAVGNDHYNLYARRSFDGGQTWTTTPAELGGVGTCHTENYLSDTGSLETCYGAGDFEQARNVSQLIGNRETILDPRYTPTSGSIAQDDGSFLYPDDERDHSKFVLVYETGDNTTVTLGEATPLDLFYSRATNWGDDYDLVEYYNSTTQETVMAWDWLEHGEDESGEASITANPGGTFFYAVWNQALEIGDEEFTDMDIIFRRVMYLDDVDSAPTATIFASLPTAVDYGPGELTFVGTGKDNDHLGAHQGIVAYEWSSDIDGVLSAEKSFSIPITDLTMGLHTFSLSVQDDEGNWSSDATTTVGVGVPNLSLHSVFLPITLH
jgi:hypothetical protein